MNDVAVLTGDLVQSSGLTPTMLSKALENLEIFSDAIAGWHSPASATRFTRNRGDGWQIVLHQPDLALRAALFLQAGLVSHHDGLRSRISIATGPATLPAGGDLNAASGPAFIASGHGLDAMKGALIAHAAGGALGAATRLADHIAQGWTVAQARAVHHMLWPRDRTRVAVAAETGVTRQAVDKALHSAGFPALDDALAMIEFPAQDTA